MNKAWSQSILDHFRSAVFDQVRVTSCYQAWILMHQNSLKGVQGKARDDIVKDMVEEKLTQLRQATDEDKMTILTADELDVRLTSIDQMAIEWAQSVLKGVRLNADKKLQARQWMQEIREIAKRVNELPENSRGAMAERISEITLDLNYAMEDGRGPKSLRLGRDETPHEHHRRTGHH